MSSCKLSVCDTGAQYSALTENSETDYISEEESLPENTQCHYHDTDFKYTELPHDRNRTSIPIPDTHIPRQTMEEIIHHPPALQIPPVEIVVAPSQQTAN